MLNECKTIELFEMKCTIFWNGGELAVQRSFELIIIEIMS